MLCDDIDLIFDPQQLSHIKSVNLKIQTFVTKKNKNFSKYAEKMCSQIINKKIKERVYYIFTT